MVLCFQHHFPMRILEAWWKQQDSSCDDRKVMDGLFAALICDLVDRSIQTEENICRNRIPNRSDLDFIWLFQFRRHGTHPGRPASDLHHLSFPAVWARPLNVVTEPISWCNMMEKLLSAGSLSIHLSVHLLPPSSCLHAPPAPLPAYLLISAALFPPPLLPPPSPPSVLSSPHLGPVHKLFSIYSMWPDARFPLGASLPGDGAGGLGCVTSGGRQEVGGGLYSSNLRGQRWWKNGTDTSNVQSSDDIIVF